jgi:hypothetical protein
MKQSLSWILPLSPFVLASGRAAWTQQWEQIVDAAKREGKIAIIGPTGSDRRDSLVQPFQQKYGIATEYFPGQGSSIAPRLSAERSPECTLGTSW